MSKPDPKRFNPGIYPFSSPIITRFSDLDKMGHINNVAMASLFEDGRVRFHSHYDLSNDNPIYKFLVAKLKVDYLAESFFPEPIDIYSGVNNIGNSSFELYQLAIQNQKPVAICTTITVSTKDGASVTIPQFWRDNLLKAKLIS